MKLATLFCNASRSIGARREDKQENASDTLGRGIGFSSLFVLIIVALVATGEKQDEDCATRARVVQRRK